MRLDKQNIQSIYDLTPLQSGMLFIYLSDRSGSNYFIQNTFDFQGNVSVDLLRQSFQKIIDRHDVLRSLFIADASRKPVHIVLKKQEADVRIFEIAPGDDVISKIGEIEKDDISNHFDLENGKLLRLTIVKVNEKTLHVVWSYHHILMDGWCSQVLIEEFFKIYSALATGTKIDLLPAPSYSSYIRWLVGFNKDSSLKYWQHYLEGYSTKTSLPRGFIEKGANTYRLAEVLVEFGAVRTKILGEFCRRASITQSTFLQAVWGCLLGKYNNCQDVVFGAVVSGRPARVPGIERMVGLFINTIPVRVTWHSKMSFQELCIDVHGKAIQSEGHHYVQLADVQKNSELGRDLIDHLMIFENFPIAEYNSASNVDLPGNTDFKVERNATFEHTNYNFEVVVQPGTDFKLKITYNSNYYASEYMTRTRAHLLRIIDTVLADPSALVSKISCLTQEEIDSLVLVNNTTYPLPGDDTIVSLFRKVVVSMPMRAALVCEGAELTFRELDEASDRVACGLISKYHVTRGSIVGVMLDRSSEMLIAMLGIIKCGGAYLPIDKQYPDERVSFMVEDSALRVVVSSTLYLERFDHDGMLVYCFDKEISEPDYSFDLEPFAPTGSDAAYIMYTSGSTGRPKGVVIGHGNVVNFFCGMDKVYLPTADDSLLALTGYTFDISVLELFWTLTRGVAVVLHTGDIQWLDRFRTTNKRVDFSLFYFSSYNNDSETDKYDLLLDSVRFADENEFVAVWTPERHFHEFGGLFPNPSVVGSALAVITSKLQIRAGSIVLPLHDPIRVAEEWSVVDNLSSGRAGVSFASGWNPNDFVLAPSSYATRHSEMFENIKTIQRLWNGEKIDRTNGENIDVSIGIFPEPVQQNIPVWITSAGNTDTFISAGSIGANVLTHLLGQEISSLAENIRLYREARKNNGFAPETGIVSLMVHTYVGSSDTETEMAAKNAFVEYLRSSAGLSKVIFENEGLSESAISPEVKDKIFENAYRRYAQKNSLIGTIDECSKRVMELINIGVDDFACLIDFGVKPSLVKEGLARLNVLRKIFSGHSRMPQVTMMQTTPAFLKAAMDDENSTSFLRSLKTVFVGGDALKDDFAQELAEKLPAAKFNMYGPTETTIWSAFSKLTDRGVTIGKPMANTEVYLLDDNNVPVPKGVTGNIYIAGLGLARGYLNRPELTAERFVSNPYRPDLRMYQTGDVGRWNSDWNIEFLGRSDFQIKVRGHRIEPGEIEYTLKQHPRVDQAVVVEKGKSSDRALVAYVVTSSAEVTRQLWEFLSERLPAYMLPTYFVRLDKFPLTYNGKIDRNQLPEPDLQGVKRVHRLPVNSTEQQLINIWEEILEKKSIGTSDNFFEMGGHSLKIVQLISRIRKDFGVQVGIREIFDHITISSQAELIFRSKRAVMDVIPVVEEAESYQLSHAQHRFWILSQFDEGSLSYVDSVGLRLEGTLDHSAMKVAINFLVKRHESLRTVFREINGEVKQVIVPYRPDWLQVEYQDATQRDNVDLFLKDLYQKEQRHKFDLSSGPLLRVRIVRTGEEEHVLFYSMHHVISDGWSMVVIAREITNAYNAIRNKHLLDDSPLPIHYKDYAAWQRKELSDDASREHEKFWLEHLLGDIPVLDLPTGRRRSAVLTHNGSSFTRTIPANDVSSLRSFCAAEGATLFMGLLSLLNAFFYRITSQDDFIIGSPVAGRDHPDLENQIGLFLNTLPIRTRVCGTDTLKQLLKKVRATVLDTYSHQVYPFDLLVEKVGVERDMSRSALFDVLLVLQNQTTTNVSGNAKGLDGISLSQIEDLERSTSRFDLEFSFMESGEELKLELIYNSDLYERSWLARFMGHFLSFVVKGVHSGQSTIDEINFVGDDESLRLITEFNDTLAPYPDQSTLVDLFRQKATMYPEGIAIRMDHGLLTYSQLDKESDKLAMQFHNCGVVKGNIVGLLIDRSQWMMIGIWGILRAGAAYMPIDPEYPLDRIQFMAEDSGIKVIVTDPDNVDVCDRLQWLVPSLQYYIVPGGYKEESYENVEHASLQLWNHVAVNAANDVEASGWKNSYTKEVFSDLEIEDLVSNVMDKVAPRVTSESDVLEVGCGSGLLLLRLSSLVGTYTATDLSDSVLSRVADRLAAENIRNVTLKQLSASFISTLGGKKFDAIVLNSVVQYFPSYQYLRSFLDQAVELLSDDGFIFIGDIRDQSLQRDYYHSCNPGGVSEQEIVRRRMLEPELFVARDLLNDYCLKLPFEANVSHSGKAAKVENELTRFRFDSIIQVHKKNQPLGGQVRKWQILGNERSEISPSWIAPAIVPDDLAYVIYTSGSTGKPKGAMIDHRGAVNRIHWMWKKYAFDRSDVILQKTTFCFDVSVWEIFMTHCFGASMVLCPRNEVYDSSAIADRICRFGVTTIHFVPSMFRVFLDQLSDDQVASLRSLKRIFASGEALTADLVNTHHTRLGTPLHNLYGPTEASVDVTYYQTTGNEAIVPIGRPIDNIRMYILDDRLKLLPHGMPGELYIAGIGLARGYLNNPGLTAERFLTNPFDDTTKVYRTGDIARWREDGNIEFLGRKDHQVKIKGYRIELNEIETILKKNDRVVDGKVILWNDQHGTNNLVAYVLLNSMVELSELRRWLALYLPEYMVPVYFVQLEKWPLTSNGKFNLKMLPDPLQSAMRGVSTHEAPRNHAEEKLVAVWRELFARDTISINDNFFELGGDSIKSVQVSARLRKFGLALKVSDILQAPILHEAAVKVEIIGDSQGSYTGGLFPVTPYQWQRLNEGFASYNQFVILLVDPLEITKLSEAFLKIVRRHEILRSSFRWSDDKWVLEVEEHVNEFPIPSFEGCDVVNPEELLKMPIVRDYIDKGQENAGNLSLRAGLFKTSTGPRLIIVANYLAIDHYSWVRLLQELSHELGQSGIRSEEQDSDSSFIKWVRTQKKIFGNLPQKERAYWNEIIYNYSEPEILPGERISTAFEIGGDVFNLLLLMNAAWSTRIEEVMLTAVGLAARDVFNTNRILIGCERSDVSENISGIGCYTSLHPLALDVSSRDVMDCLIAIKETYRRVPGFGVSFGHLAQERKTPLSQTILFRFFSQKANVDKLPGFVFEYDGRTISQHNASHKLEINCYMLNGKLRVEMAGSGVDLHNAEEFCRNIERQLNDIVQTGLNTQARKITPSDLGDLEMSIDTLDTLFED